jgi:hypothetical protein
MANCPKAGVVLAASGGAVVGDGQLVGFFVGSTSSLTLKIWDALSAAGNVLLDTTGVLAVGWYALPVTFNTGIFVTFGGTGKITLVYQRQNG